MIENKWDCAECKERPSDEPCAKCGDLICTECGRWISGKWVCNECETYVPSNREYEHEVQSDIDNDYDERIATIIDEFRA